MGSIEAPVNIAIVGGGPGGLAAAISFSRLPFVSVTIYEQSPEPRVVGAGLSLSSSAWKVLDLLEAADGVKGCSRHHTHRRNAYTGEIVHYGGSMNGSADKRGAIRARRSRLQSGLLERVDPWILQYNKKLVLMEDLDTRGVLLKFQDQTEVVADLVVGCDGIRSAVRRTLYPNYHLQYTGSTGWRTLVPVSSIAHLEDIVDTTGWWFGKTSQVYFARVDDDDEEVENSLFEISVTSANEPEVPGKTVMWGIPATNERVISRIPDFDPKVQEAVASVPEGQWREFAFFTAAPLEQSFGWDKVVLIGDAARPMAGAFGSGATFAMEDGWLLAQALNHTQLSPNAIKDAINLFNNIRTPYFAKIYEWKKNLRAKLQAIQEESEGKGFDEVLKAKVINFPGSDSSLDFVFQNDIGQVWKDYLNTQLN